jgi:hypothetical protein
MQPLAEHKTNRDQERPCARCIKRNIGHLCHDEPREPESATKKAKSQHSNSAAEDGSTPDQLQSNIDNGINNSFEQSQEQHSQDNGLGLDATALSQGGPLQIVQPSPVSGLQANALDSNSNQCKLPIALILSEGELTREKLSGTPMTGWVHRINSKICITTIHRICSTLPK